MPAICLLSQKGGVGKTALALNGAYACVANAGAKSISVIDTATNTIVATVAVGFIPVHVSASPDVAHVYVTNAGSNSVSVIDTITNTVMLKPMRKSSRRLELITDTLRSPKN